MAPPAFARSYTPHDIRAAGGKAPDFTAPGKIVEVTLEQWQAFDPEVIYGCGPDRAVEERFFSKPGWKDVSAVKNNRVYYMPCDLTCRASARTSAFAANRWNHDTFTPLLTYVDMEN